MNNIAQIITQAEGRRLEYKRELPANTDLAKTAIAFANDAGGDIYIGIDNERNVIGLPEEELTRVEEQISNLIYDRCYPTILPEISFLTVEEKHLIRVRVYRGSMPPYYLKPEGKWKGTYIRVGSSNRLADETLLTELERRRRNVSFDSEIVLEKTVEELNIGGFKKLYETKTGEEMTIQTLRKLELAKEEQGKTWPTNALVLLSDDASRFSLFPNARVECARFKGCSSDEFIDQKSITSPVGMQAEEAYNFVLRHVNKGARVEGVYTVSRWEYPVKAIREIIHFRDSVDLPMYMGEIGHNTNEWQADFCQVMRDHNIGYTFWPYKKLDGSSFVGITPPRDWQLVVDFAEASRNTYKEIREARPDQNTARKALTDFIQACKLEHCTVQEDYIRSLGMGKNGYILSNQSETNNN